MGEAAPSVISASAQSAAAVVERGEGSRVGMVAEGVGFREKISRAGREASWLHRRRYRAASVRGSRNYFAILRIVNDPRIAGAKPPRPPAAAGGGAGPRSTLMT